MSTAGGQSYPGWRAGWTNLEDGESYVTGWNQLFPALGSLAGTNVCSKATTGCGCETGALSRHW